MLERTHILWTCCWTGFFANLDRCWAGIRCSFVYSLYTLFHLHSFHSCTGDCEWLHTSQPNGSQPRSTCKSLLVSYIAQLYLSCVIICKITQIAQNSNLPWSCNDIIALHECQYSFNHCTWELNCTIVHVASYIFDAPNYALKVCLYCSTAPLWT